MRRVEKASGLGYPKYYIEPIVPLAAQDLLYGEVGILYARTLPVEVLNQVEIVVQLSAPLILFGSRATIHAVIAHEFQHYVEFSRRFMMVDTISDEITTSLFESTYVDSTRLYDIHLIFNDKKLIKLVESRFPNGLKDNELHRKTIRNWLEKRLPAARLSPESNVVAVKMSSIVNSNFDPLLKLKLQELERASRPTV